MGGRGRAWGSKRHSRQLSGEQWIRGPAILTLEGRTCPIHGGLTGRNQRAAMIKLHAPPTLSPPVEALGHQEVEGQGVLGFVVFIDQSSKSQSRVEGCKENGRG